jgi:hypothetical protein
VWAAHGISPTTYFSWLERGRNGESPYLEFLNAVTRAERQGQVNLVRLIHSHAVRDWRAAAFLPERRPKKDWGPLDTPRSPRRGRTRSSAAYSKDAS